MIILVRAQSWLGQSLTPVLIVAAVGLCGLSTVVAGECSVGKMEANVWPPVSNAGRA